MKFRYYLENVTGIGIYPLMSLIVFFSFFVGCLIYVISADKKVMEEMNHIPLDEQ